MKPAPKHASSTSSPGKRRASNGRGSDTNDSLAPIMRLGSTHRSLGIVLALLGALLIHGTAGARAATSLFDLGDFARLVRSQVLEQLRLRYDIDVDPPLPE